MTTTDTTIIGNGGSAYATESLPGAIPLERVRDLFDFTAANAPVFTMRDGLPAEVPGRHAIIHEGTGDVLNVTSKRYGIHQFSEVLLDNLLTLTDSTSDDLEIVGAGLLRRGAVGWVQVQANRMRVAGDDLAPTITLASSHDGSLATSYRVGLFRFACSNQIGALRAKGQGVYRLKHTLHSKVRFGEARGVLGLMFDEAEVMAAHVAQLVDQPVSDAEWEKIVKRLHPAPAQDASLAAQTRWENRRATLRRLWTEDERVAPYRGTAWGVMQTFSTFHHHERGQRRTDGGAVTRAGYVMHEYLSGRLNRIDRATDDAIAAVLAGA